MGKHLASCREKKMNANKMPETNSPEKAKLFHIVAEGRYLPEYWMHFEVPADSKLTDLDDFLRKVWVECCGHLSAFTIGGTAYSSEPADFENSDFEDEDSDDEDSDDEDYEDEETEDEDSEDEDEDIDEKDSARAEFDSNVVKAASLMFSQPKDKSLDAKLCEVLKPGTQFFYEYDFGSTTHLKLKVVTEYQGNVSEQTVQILARNEPPPIVCSSCGKPATQVCTACLYSGRGWLCDGCVAEHDCGEDALLPVVNSPRVGVCGYTGR
jgi:hypothetical protein